MGKTVGLTKELVAKRRKEVAGKTKLGKAAEKKEPCKE